MNGGRRSPKVKAVTEEAVELALSAAKGEEAVSGEAVGRKAMIQNARHHPEPFD